MPLFRIGEPIEVHHHKPWLRGRLIRMRGQVSSFDGHALLMQRRFHSPSHAYDSLREVQRPGDWGTIELHEGAWVCRRRYCRRDGTLIGELYNIQTPTRFIPGGACYVDLEIDVAYQPGRRHEVSIQDEDELDLLVADGQIPADVAEMARQVAREVARRLEAWDGRSDLDWDVRPEEPESGAAVERFLDRWPEQELGPRATRAAG